MPIVQLDFATTLRDIVRAKSVAGLANSIVARIAASRSVVLARIWLANDSEGTLALTASAGNPSGGGSYSRLEGEFREMAVADQKINEIARHRVGLVVRGLRGDEDWLTNPSWAARQSVRAFIGLPLIPDDRAEGVLAIFDREMPGEELIAQLQLVTDIAALRNAELRAVVETASPLPVVPDAPPLKVVTRAELRQIEKQSIESALAQSHGKVFGAGGAAALLGMRPTTLASRIKALGLSR